MVRAFGSNDVGAYFATFHPDATFVFYNVPESLGSLAAYRGERERWQREDGFRIVSCRSTRQEIQVVGDVGIFTHAVVTRVSTHSGEETLHERETIVFARQDDGTWLGVHEHLSPYPEGGQG